MIEDFGKENQKILNRISLTIYGVIRYIYYDI